jgi:hypothetical protein
MKAKLELLKKKQSNRKYMPPNQDTGQIILSATIRGAVISDLEVGAEYGLIIKNSPNY